MHMAAPAVFANIFFSVPEPARLAWGGGTTLHGDVRKTYQL